MMQRFIDAANANPAIIGLILCGIMLIAVLILTLDRQHEKRMKARIRQLKTALASKQVRIAALEKEVWDLKVQLFAAREDGKIAFEKKQIEIDHLKAKIQQLETDKKQLSKWGTEK